MCRFLSAIVKKNGDVHALPEYSDSHSELIAHLGIKEGEHDLRHFARVEFTPDEPASIADITKYSLTIDESREPAWFDEDMKVAVAKKLKGIISKMLIVNEKRAMLLGGVWILAGQTIIERAVQCRIVSMSGASRIDSTAGVRVGVMWGTSQVGEMGGTSKVGVMRETSQVGEMRGTSQVGEMRGTSQVGVMWETSQVGVMRETSQVGVMRETSKVGEMWGTSQVGEMRGTPQVGVMWETSQVGVMWETSQVGVMRGTSQVGEMWGTSKIQNDKRVNQPAKV